VELLNEARGYDWSFIWALSYEHFIERGDAFVGVTHVPENVDALKKFNADRYAALSFANPNPAETCGGRGALTAPSEEGLRWDAISQIGALLKNQGPMGLMPGLRVERLYMTSHHGHAVTYAIAMQGGAKLPNGKPIYDGFLIKSSDNPVRLSRCDAAPQSGDPRQAVRNVGVPVIRVVPQGEIPRGNSYSRADSDDPADRFRLYEAPGAPRMDKIYFQQLPAKEDQVKAGQSASDAKWPFTYQCGPDSRSELVDYPAMRFIVDVAFDHLDRWVRTGTPPPRAERIAGGDMFGNAKGGVRNPYIEVPTATYVPIGPGQCSSIMTRTEFDRARFDELYGSSEKYLARFNESVDRLVKEGWITAGDAMRIKAENGSAPRRN
jgi:hypothetical protein